MVLYQGMYNVAHFEINNNLTLYEDVLVGDEYDYKRLRKICFVSGSVYINKAIVNGSEIKGGAHVTIQDESIFINIVPENETDGIVIGITFYLDDSGNMYAYTEKREGGPSGSVVESFNGRTGQVVPANTDYNAGMIGYDNTVSQLVAENTQDAIDELDQEIDLIQGEIDDLDAAHIPYDNTTSTLAATNVQDALDELDNDLLGKQNALTFDTEPTASSLNPVTSDGVYHAIENVESLIPTEASEISYSNTVSGLTAIEVQSAIDELASGKQDTLTFDSTPTDGSTNPVTSDGVYDAIDTVDSKIPEDASDVPYDNTVSQLTATDVQAAIDEVNGKVPDDASDIPYDNTVSQLTATDVQAALDEIAHDVLTSGVASFNNRTGAVLPAAHDYDGDQVDYDNTTSGLTATDVQAAIDEVNSKAGVSSFNGRTGAISPTSGDYDASLIGTGTFPAQINANATAQATLANAQVRNISAGSTDLTEGVSVLSTGEIYLYYEP